MKWHEMVAMTDEELIATFDATSVNTVVGLDWFREELTRRAFERSAVESQELAKASLEEAREARALAAASLKVANRNYWVAIGAFGAAILLGLVQIWIAVAG